MKDSELIGPNAHLVPKRRTVSLVVRFDEGSTLHKAIDSDELEVGLWGNGEYVEMVKDTAGEVESIVLTCKSSVVEEL